jgi:hypothetical protein
MNLESKNLGQGIYLFKNVFKNKEKIYKFILDSKNGSDIYFNKNTWHDWSPWGNYTKAYPNTTDSSYTNSTSEGADLLREGLEIFEYVLDHVKNNFTDTTFFERHGFPRDFPTSIKQIQNREQIGDRRFQMADFVVFETNKNVDNDWQMWIHQDTVPHFGMTQNHMFNFNIYVNDDYEGGEIVFFKDEGIEKTIHTDKATGKQRPLWYVEDYFVYKMEAGDGMIFPVDLYHGVLPITGGGEKYYIRQFITHIAEDEFESEKKKFLESGKTEEEFETMLADIKSKTYANRITPVIYNSIEDIPLDTSTGTPQIACIIKSRKDISSLIGGSNE